MQLPEHPLGTQHTSPEVQMAPDAVQLQGFDTPQVSATETLHWLPQLLAGVQHMAVVALHSSPFGHPAVHWTCWPQLLVTVSPPQSPAQAAFVGVQHAFS